MSVKEAAINVSAKKKMSTSIELSFECIAKCTEVIGHNHYCFHLRIEKRYKIEAKALIRRIDDLIVCVGRIRNN